MTSHTSLDSISGCHHTSLYQGSGYSQPMGPSRNAPQNNGDDAKPLAVTTQPRIYLPIRLFIKVATATKHGALCQGTLLFLTILFSVS